ncbi:hypothetical protein WICMUC_004430 [Wickerhamomyces mucosus]|uniref:Uncharacterized protein n=1 Tax=Wickerhamomyces mucosus TaxID=1378264 RepID=A0A9P8TBI6_9ASCO|nr:hypothetical protein WICMUC_004430 [Wickerhamomyces mucosus]
MSATNSIIRQYQSSNASRPATKVAASNFHFSSNIGFPSSLDITNSPNKSKCKIDLEMISCSETVGNLISSSDIKSISENAVRSKSSSSNENKVTDVLSQSSYQFSTRLKSLFVSGKVNEDEPLFSEKNAEISLDSTATTLNVIADSSEETWVISVSDSENVTHQLNDIEMDPIYETYVRYFHQQNNGEEMCLNERSSVAIKSANDLSVKASRKPFEILEDLDNYFMNYDDPIENKENLGPLTDLTPHNKNLRRTSTLTKLRTKTREFLRQVSKLDQGEPISVKVKEYGWKIFPNVPNFPNVPIIKSPKSIDFHDSIDNGHKDSLRSITLRHSFTKDACRQENIGNKASKNYFFKENFNKRNYEVDQDSLTQLFDSPEYRKRLKDGSIRVRKIYEKEKAEFTESSGRISDSQLQKSADSNGRLEERGNTGNGRSLSVKSTILNLTRKVTGKLM